MSGFFQDPGPAENIKQQLPFNCGISAPEAGRCQGQSRVYDSPPHLDQEEGSSAFHETVMASSLISSPLIFPHSLISDSFKVVPLCVPCDLSVGDKAWGRDSWVGHIPNPGGRILGKEKTQAVGGHCGRQIWYFLWLGAHKTYLPVWVWHSFWVLGRQQGVLPKNKK